MLNEDELISKSTNFTEVELKFFIMYCSTSNVQLDMQNINIICVAYFCQHSLYCPCE